MPNAQLLECFANPAPAVEPGSTTQRDFVIEHVSEEFTSVCPKTGHPDFGHVTIRFIPDQLCVELKSLKLYYQSFRNEGIFYEAVTNRIADDLAQAMAPKWLEVRTDWKGRGGIRSTITVTVGTPPGNALSSGDAAECDHSMKRTCSPFLRAAPSSLSSSDHEHSR